MSPTWILALPLAGLVTLGLLAGMAGLVGATDDPGLPPTRPPRRAALRLLDRRPHLEEPAPRPRLPPRPPPPEAPPPPPAPAPRRAQTTRQEAPLPAASAGPRLDLPLDLGGGVTLPTGLQGEGCCRPVTREEPPVPVLRVPPRYPPRARRGGIEGWIRVAFTVNTQGDVDDVEVLDAQPPKTWDAVAREAVRRWRFRPRMVDGEAVAARVTQTLRFQIDGS